MTGDCRRCPDRGVPLLLCRRCRFHFCAPCLKAHVDRHECAGDGLAIWELIGKTT